jgi:NADH-quinone oxidoreductase subunit D
MFEMTNSINKSEIEHPKSEIIVTDALQAYNNKIAAASVEDMVLNMGPQHPSTHGVLRLELITDGEIVKEVITHMGYLHRCFEKHAENLTYQQTIPFTDRLDYLASMNNSHAWVMGVERMLGIDKDIPKRVEYIRVLVCEMNRIASHLIAVGTYGIDIGAFTPFLWCFKDREHIMGMLEWACYITTFGWEVYFMTCLLGLKSAAASSLTILNLKWLS